MNVTVKIQIESDHEVKIIEINSQKGMQTDCSLNTVELNLANNIAKAIQEHVDIWRENCRAKMSWQDKVILTASSVLMIIPIYGIYLYIERFW